MPFTPPPRPSPTLSLRISAVVDDHVPFNTPLPPLAHPPQGVSTDAVLDDIVKQLEGQEQREDGTTMKLAFHMEPYPGEVAARLI